MARRRAASGPNVMPPVGRRRPLVLLARQLSHLLAVLLWIAALLAALAGMPALALAIVVVVVLNALFAFWQEHRADRATERLRALLPSRATVVRSGRTSSVPVAELVVGDLVVLEAGDRVGADMTLVEAHSVTLDESLLTGESAAVPHGTGDRLLSGTFLQQGGGRAVVDAIGAATALADISRLAASAHRPPSPLTRQLDRVVRVIAIIAVSVGASLGVGSLLLGLGTTEAFLFGVGVSVALVPEGLLPTVTLSLARGAQQMATRNALVRRLDAVETLGATTFVCTDKTGTLTQNRMSVVVVATPAGRYDVAGSGYEPTGAVAGPVEDDALRAAAAAAVRCVTGRVVERDGSWVALGDPLEAAIHALALRTEAPVDDVETRRPFTTDRMLSSALHRGEVSVIGAPEAVLARSTAAPPKVRRLLGELTGAGLRVLAVARRSWQGGPSDAMEHDLELLGLLGLQDPPRPDVADALLVARRAGVAVAMVTGDHRDTARAIATQVGLLREGGLVVEGRDLPADDGELAGLLRSADGAVVARVTPADKLRIARALRAAGHVVAMTGDGVNDAPALREADVGVAMGASGSDVARESADLVLLDDHFATIVGAIELGRATFRNVRRFLTFHLTDNVAELAPFAVWAMSGGHFPLALGVLQVLALDIGTDLMPALALGAEPARPDVMQHPHRRVLIDRALAVRAFAVLGATEAVASLAAFATVLLAHGWRWGTAPAPADLALASGTAFTVIAAMQVANSFACRSVALPVWRMDPFANRLLLYAVAAELVLLLVFVGVPPVAEVLGGSFPHGEGWLMAMGGAAALLLVDAAAKSVRRSRPAATPG
ncbi:cation-transporting P-type ATPase [Nocardioides humi]|uniref:Cation-transporting P-type ATPase n=1 Tax=Nocardioides humi TaxID=449461 RepID=A0ABN2BJN0_9ACTN